VAVLAAAVAVLAVGGAQPARADTVGGTPASNYRSRILAVRPAVPGVTVELVDATHAIRLTNTSGTDVVVLGYQGEPWLRVGPAGAFQNRHSPAAYLNRATTTSAPLPAGADPAAPPAWQQVSTRPSATFVDHRTHWMGVRDPPEVKAAPHRTHVVMRSWKLVLRRGGQTITVTGDALWVPGPSPLPWLGLSAACLLAVLAAAGRRRRWPELLAGLAALLVAADVARTGLLWAGATAPAAAKMSWVAPALLWWVIAMVAVRRLLAGSHGWGLVLVTLAAGLGVIVSGTGELAVLLRSQVATAPPTWASRALVAATLGLGLGLAGAGSLRLWRLQGLAPSSHAL
jgi:hypothetical protein